MCINASQYIEINNLARTLSRQRIIRFNNLILLAKCGDSAESYVVYDAASDQICNGYLIPIELFEQFKPIQLSYL